MFDFSEWLAYQAAVWPEAEADRLMHQLEREIEWQQPNIRLFGKSCPLPRLTAWYADSGLSYRYSGIVHQALPWTPLLKQIKKVAEQCAGGQFNSVLLNLYRHGQDSNGWHADDEPELDHHSPIASVSFGACRRFRVRAQGATAHWDLQHGSVLVMRAGAQQQMQHCVPKTARAIGPRINLTFRTIRSR